MNAVPEGRERTMQVQILGTGGYHPNDRRHTACVFLPQAGIAFDAGTSFFRVPPRLRTRDLHVFLSHAHLDHVVGLTYVLPPLLLGNLDRVVVYGVHDTLQTVREHLFHPRLFPVTPPLEYVDLASQENLEIGGCQITHQPLPGHPGGSTAYRLETASPTTDGTRTMAYVTDTVADGSYLEFVRSVDLLIHECNFPDSLAEWCERTGHSHTSQVTRLAANAQVGRLVLFHVDPSLSGDDPLDLAAARSCFPNTELAEDLMELSL